MPESKEVRLLAREFKISKPRFKRNQDYCILCGLCVRYCQEVKGWNSIGFVGRGTDRVVAWVPVENYKKFCENCMECKDICPTGVFPSNIGIAQNTVLK